MAVLFMILSVNLDSLAVGFAYGVRRVRIPLISAVVISAFSVFYSALALTAGAALTAVLPPEISTYIGAVILLVIGMVILVGAFRQADRTPSPPEPKYGTLINWGIKSLGITVSVVRDPSLCDFDSSQRIDAREAVYLSLALSADAVGVGLGSALSGVIHPLVPVLVGLSQLVLLYSGLGAGKFLSHRLHINKRICEIFAGALLIILAILHIFM